MSNDELDRLLARAHKDVTLFDYNVTKVPCIILEEKRFDNIMKTIAGKPVSVETNLNILQDGLGHVFVDVSLNFSQVGMVEKLLLYANDFFEFFEALAGSSMLALSSPHSEYGKSNVFMIQLPKPERAMNALEIIKKGLKK
ncbi:MAG: hypothetical protein E6L02_07915 [Thaumarchaeota archaeon]|nr:MAG: hypothetical protein E6L02_07915 [Nitrososphaerota archaeon]